MSADKYVPSPFIPTDGEPRANFAVFAGMKGQPQGGYRDYQGAFRALTWAKEWAEHFLSEHPQQVEWVQVTDIFHGSVEEFRDGVWEVIRESDPD